MSAGMLASGLEDRIKNPERLIVLVLAHPGCSGERAVKRVCLLLQAPHDGHSKGY